MTDGDQLRVRYAMLLAALALLREWTAWQQRTIAAQKARIAEHERRLDALERRLRELEAQPMEVAFSDN